MFPFALRLIQNASFCVNADAKDPTARSLFEGRAIAQKPAKGFTPHCVTTRRPRAPAGVKVATPEAPTPRPHPIATHTPSGDRSRGGVSSYLTCSQYPRGSQERRACIRDEILFFFHSLNFAPIFTRYQQGRDVENRPAAKNHPRPAGTRRTRGQEWGTPKERSRTASLP